MTCPSRSNQASKVASQSRYRRSVADQTAITAPAAGRAGLAKAGGIGASAAVAAVADQTAITAPAAGRAGLAKAGGIGASAAVAAVAVRGAQLRLAGAAAKCNTTGQSRPDRPNAPVANPGCPAPACGCRSKVQYHRPVAARPTQRARGQSGFELALEVFRLVLGIQYFGQLRHRSQIVDDDGF